VSCIEVAFVIASDLLLLFFQRFFFTHSALVRFINCISAAHAVTVAINCISPLIIIYSSFAPHGA
jgi:hypothetical protein